MAQPETQGLPQYEYLGDGAYARWDGYQIGLLVGDHRSEPVVYLEPEVLRALVAFARRVAGPGVVP